MNEHESTTPKEQDVMPKNSPSVSEQIEVPKSESTINQIPSNKAEKEEDESDIEESEVSEDYSGNESDAEETYDDEEGQEASQAITQQCYPSQRPGLVRDPNPDLPETVTVLTTKEGCKVYLVGTAHFSKESQEEVIKTVALTKPDLVLLELCQSRISILNLDEETLLKEAKDISFSKVQLAIKQNGLVQGIMHLLLLSMSAHLTKQLGMAPGGEFRVALKAARHIEGCQVVLGDRSVQVTLRRALSSLTWWQTIRLAWYILTSKEPISKEDVEKYKQKDFLEEMLREMTGEFPALSRVFVEERDLFLAKSLYNTACLLPVIKIPKVNDDEDHEEETPPEPTETVPSVIVGVVGIGHTPGIVKNWDNIKDTDLKYLMEIPKPSKVGITMKWTLRAALVALLSWSCYKGYSWTRTLF